MEETTALTLHGFGCCRRAKANLFICHERERERERGGEAEGEAEETCDVPLAMWKHARKSAAGDVLSSAKMRLVFPFLLPMIRYHLLPPAFACGDRRGLEGGSEREGVKKVDKKWWIQPWNLSKGA
ncbi:unnamed protein product, partial [Musa textilis]